MAGYTIYQVPSPPISRCMVETEYFTDANGEKWGRIKEPSEDLCVQLLAKVSTKYELSDDVVNDNTGDLIDSEFVDLSWLIARSSMAPMPVYEDGEIVVTSAKSHTFEDGEGSLGVTVRADKDTYNVNSIDVSAHLY